MQIWRFKDAVSWLMDVCSSLLALTGGHDDLIRTVRILKGSREEANTMTIYRNDLNGAWLSKISSSKLRWALFVIELCVIRGELVHKVKDKIDFPLNVSSEGTASHYAIIITNKVCLQKIKISCEKCYSCLFWDFCKDCWSGPNAPVKYTTRQRNKKPYHQYQHWMRTLTTIRHTVTAIFPQAIAFQFDMSTNLSNSKT